MHIPTQNHRVYSWLPNDPLASSYRFGKQKARKETNPTCALFFWKPSSSVTDNNGGKSKTAIKKFQARIDWKRWIWASEHSNYVKAFGVDKFEAEARRGESKESRWVKKGFYGEKNEAAKVRAICEGSVAKKPSGWRCAIKSDDRVKNPRVQEGVKKEEAAIRIRNDKDLH